MPRFESEKWVMLWAAPCKARCILSVYCQRWGVDVQGVDVGGRKDCGMTGTFSHIKFRRKKQQQQLRGGVSCSILKALCLGSGGG